MHRKIVPGIVLIYVGIVCVWFSLVGDVDHDEHQFMASAFVVANDGLHPYKDFAYFHMPNLVYLYAPFFQLTGYPFLAARLFVALCAFGICLTIYQLTRSLFSRGESGSLILSICSIALVIHSPLFQSAVSHTWNHAPSVICALLAFVFHSAGVRKTYSPRYFLMSGLLLGMAIGIRLSLAFMIIPFLLILLIIPPYSLKTKTPGLFAFALGGVLANLPAIFFLISSGNNFIFGNLGYPVLNTLYRKQMDWNTAMTLAGKIRYFKEVVLSNPVDLMAFVVSGFCLALLAGSRIWRHLLLNFEILLLLLCLPFLYWGSLAPTPSWYQYFFAPMPFVVLLGLYALASCQSTAARRFAIYLFVVVAIISVIYGSPFTKPRYLKMHANPLSWEPIRLHRASVEVKAIVGGSHGNGRILTLSPLYAVEVKLPIYPSFVTAPFGWRISGFLSEEERMQRLIIGSSDLDSLVKENPPLAILAGREEKNLEKPLIETAMKIGYVPMITSEGITLWVPPR